jgi:2-desacetyl-2-hydroxyethyl bacteriochlorophyllide A dehydrogenase
MIARAVQFTAPYRVELVPVELPSPPAGSVVVRTAYSGISGGTELLAYRGELDPDTVLDERLSGLSGTFRYPFRYGYSCVGRVEQGTAEVPEGTQVFAFHPHQDRFVAGAAELVVLPPDTDPRLATLLPLVETALQLTLDAGPVQHETVVVVGLGAVGLLTALLLRRAGAGVLGAEPRAWGRDVACSVGVDAVPPERLPQEVRARTGGRGVPVLVELSGAPAALPAALPLLAHEGTALVGSWYGSKEVRLPLGAEFHRRRLTIRSSQVSTVPAALQGRWDVRRRRAVARQLLAELPLDAVATTEFAVTEVGDAFAALERGEPGVVHAALRYE